MTRTTKTESRIDRLEVMMEKLIDQNIASSQRIETVNAALGQRIDALGQRVDATNQRIDSIIQKIDAQQQEILKIHQRLDQQQQEITNMYNLFAPMLEKLPEAIQNQIGFNHKSDKNA